MTATEELRRMLDERGAEWETDRSGFRVMWGKPVDEFHDTMQFKAVNNALPNGGLNVHICGFTPEQAIAATLGSCNCTNSERTDVPRLPHFWTHDGTLHIEATRMPTRIVVCEGGTCEFVPKRELDASEAENAKLRELVRGLVYATHPADRARLIADAAEFGIEVD